MKYKTFVQLRSVGCISVVGLGLFGIIRGCKSEPATPPQSVSSPAPVAAQPNTSPASDGGLTDVDREVLRLQKEPTSNGTPDKNGLKWRIKQGGVTIELRCDLDKGYTTWNRVKIDANGNKQFDETWAFKKDGTVERRVAPADDQNYTQTFRLDGEKWVPK